MDNFEEYDDPVLYDLENDMYTEDINFLSKWLEHTKGPIIDIACGTGRVTIPLAKKGHRMVGIDAHSGMLDEAKRKSKNLNLSIEWQKQDCTDLNLDLKSNLIFTVGNSFQHFLTNEAQDSLLKSIHRHLDEKGVFILNTRFPSKDELLQTEDEEFWRSYEDPKTKQIIDVYTLSNYDSLNQIQKYTTIRRSRGGDEETTNEKVTNIQLRYVYPKEMERLLNQHGFNIVEIYEDWHGTPISNQSKQMIYVCKKG
ncbi:methyltransferase domain-containing protein [Ornithinibacillus sp. L9]|uniref:Methyltransferase domain-containing protein n=1 Tax=Ornithinibacillus caprae TaxID=2678566 RepID=A0A6N8FFL1_9BACI|nr:class I SAM-dependent methyltransferase [Ornithinibacillus caprae]MUK87991.1 methyltransferase domain-containing protein [Ornithinibacillus caprae]